MVLCLTDAVIVLQFKENFNFTNRRLTEVYFGTELIQLEHKLTDNYYNLFPCTEAIEPESCLSQ